MAFTTYTVGPSAGPGIDFTSLQAAIDAASDGDVIEILEGTYVLPSTLNVEKDITIQGESEAGVILDASAIDGYGIYLTGNGATLSTFTLLGPAGGSPGGNYGIKAQPASGEDEVTGLTLDHITVKGSLRSEVDLNGVHNSTLSNITADGNGTDGVGIALTDSTGIVLENITTTGNNWGSIALYTTGNWFEAGTGDITFQGTYSHTEAIGIFSQDESATANLGAVTFPPAFTDDGDGVFLVRNDSFREPGADSNTFTFFFGSEADATAFALGLAKPDNSVVIDPDGNFVVSDGMSIQAAIDAAAPGSTIIVHAGTYAEQLTITKGISIVADEGAVLKGTLLSHLGVPDGTHLSDFMEANHPGYSAGGTGLTISADDVSVSGLTVKGFIIGVQIGTSDGVALTGNTFTDNITGIVKSTAAQVTDFTVNDNTFTHGIQGIIIQAASNGSGSFDGITMNGNTFTDLSEKGMYFEQLSNATLAGNSFDDVGNYGRIAPPFGPASQDGEFGQAIDINLKYETYSNVVFTDTTITNSGHSDRNGAADPGVFGAAIGIKIRDDAPSYNSVPGDFNGQLTFNGLTIDGTSTGVRVGEPGKNNGGPDVHLIDLKVSNASVTDVENATHKALGGLVTVDLAADETGLDGSGSQAPLAVNGNDLANTLIGGKGDDTLAGGKGNDILIGGKGTGDVAHFSGTRDGYLIEELSHGTYRVTDINTADGDDGVDTLVGVEGITFGGTPGIVFELDANSPTYAGSVVRFHQNFATDTSGIVTQIGSDGYGAVARVADHGWHGVVSADGDGFYGVITENGTDTGPFSRFDHYRTEFGGGYEASVAVYLDPNLMALGEGFDISVAANGQDNAHQRDFIIHVTKDTSTGQLLVGGSNNSNFDPVENLETGNHVAIVQAGWYTFDYRFYEGQNGALEVAMNLYDSSGKWIFTEVRSDPTDLIATEVGGNRYLWFTNIDVANGIAIDDVTLRTFGSSPIELRSNAGPGAFSPVAEGTTAIGNVNASGSNPGGLTYAIAGTADGAFFTIDAGGNLSFASGRDFENPTDAGANNIYTVTVVALDGFGNAAAETYNIAVTDLAVSTPTDTNGATGGSVAEGAANGTAVGITAHASDGAGPIIYSLLDNAGGRFAINATTGVVTVANGALLDFETTTSHNITVQASDGTHTAQQTFAIAITDVQGAVLIGSNRNDVINGTSGPPNPPASGSPFATTEADFIRGGKGNDRIDGLAGNDKLLGDAGNDVIVGGDDDDILRGGAGNDKMFGGNGNDLLAGGAGNDRLDGGAGTDTLIGGAGRDSIIFKTGYGADTFLDYEAGIDDIFLAGTGVANYSALKALMTQTAPSVVTIDFGGGDQLIIHNATIAKLNQNQADFHF